MEVCFNDINILLDESKRFKDYLSKNCKIKITQKIALNLLSKGYGFLDFETIKIANTDDFKSFEDLTAKELIELKSQKITIIQKRFKNEHSKEVSESTIEKSLKPLKITTLEVNKYINSKSKIGKIFSKKEIFDETHTYIETNINNKPILMSDNAIRTHTFCYGDESRILMLYKRLIFQKIEKNEPFIYFKDREKSDVIINEILDYSKLCASSREIKIIDNLVPLNLLNHENVFSLFQGTDVFKSEFKDFPKKTSVLYNTLYSLNIASKAKYRKKIHIYSVIEDFYNYKNIIIEANNFLFKAFEHTNLEEDLNIFKEYEKSFFKMVDEISNIKDKISHEEKSNYLLNIEDKNKSYIFVMPESDILTSALLGRIYNDIAGLLGVPIEDPNIDKIIEMKPKCRKAKMFLYDNLSEYYVPCLAAQHRALGSGIIMNGNNINNINYVDKDMKDSILANSATKIYYQSDIVSNEIFKNVTDENGKIINIPKNKSFFHSGYIEDYATDSSVLSEIR